MCSTFPTEPQRSPNHQNGTFHAVVKRKHRHAHAHNATVSSSGMQMSASEDGVHYPCKSLPTRATPVSLRRRRSTRAKSVPYPMYNCDVGDMHNSENSLAFVQSSSSVPKARVFHVDAYSIDSSVGPPSSGPPSVNGDGVVEELADERLRRLSFQSGFPTQHHPSPRAHHIRHQSQPGPKRRMSETPNFSGVSDPFFQLEPQMPPEHVPTTPSHSNMQPWDDPISELSFSPYAFSAPPSSHTTNYTSSYYHDDPDHERTHSEPLFSHTHSLATNMEPPLSIQQGHVYGQVHSHSFHNNPSLNNHPQSVEVHRASVLRSHHPHSFDPVQVHDVSQWGLPVVEALTLENSALNGTNGPVVHPQHGSLNTPVKEDGSEGSQPRYDLHIRFTSNSQKGH